MPSHATPIPVPSLPHPTPQATSEGIVVQKCRFAPFWTFVVWLHPQTGSPNGRTSLASPGSFSPTALTPGPAELLSQSSAPAACVPSSPALSLRCLPLPPPAMQICGVPLTHPGLGLTLPLLRPPTLSSPVSWMGKVIVGMSSEPANFFPTRPPHPSRLYSSMSKDGLETLQPGRLLLKPKPQFTGLASPLL